MEVAPLITTPSFFLTEKESSEKTKNRHKPKDRTLSVFQFGGIRRVNGGPSFSSSSTCYGTPKDHISRPLILRSLSFVKPLCSCAGWENPREAQLKCFKESLPPPWNCYPSFFSLILLYLSPERLYLLASSDALWCPSHTLYKDKLEIPRSAQILHFLKVAHEI